MPMRCVANVITIAIVIALAFFFSLLLLTHYPSSLQVPSSPPSCFRLEEVTSQRIPLSPHPKSWLPPPFFLNSILGISSRAHLLVPPLPLPNPDHRSPSAGNWRPRTPNLLWRNHMLTAMKIRRCSWVMNSILWVPMAIHVPQAPVP